MDWITHEPENVYHAMSKSGAVMSSHMLSKFRNSPLLYNKTVRGLVPEVSSDAFTLGRATHKLILEGQDAFNQQYTVSDGPINPTTGSAFGKTTKKFMEWEMEQLGEIVSNKDFDFINQLQGSVWNHPIAMRMLDDGVAEGVVRADIEGVTCQIRMDFYNQPHGLIDLKTCAELKWFEYDCKKYGYINQLAFYRAVIREKVGVNVPVHIIAVEKVEPFSAGVWLIAPDALDQAEYVNNATLQRYKDCLDRDVWPTGYEAIRIIDSL